MYNGFEPIETGITMMKIKLIFLYKVVLLKMRKHVIKNVQKCSNISQHIGRREAGW